jgi:hypothetical protein
MSGHQQPDQRQLLEGARRPVLADEPSGQRTQHPRDAGGLGVDHPGRDLVDRTVATALQRHQPRPDLVCQPHVQLVEPEPHPLGPPRRALGRRLRVDAAARALRAGQRGPPRRGVRRGLGLGDPARRPQLDQPERVLARHLPTRARAGRRTRTPPCVEQHRRPVGTSRTPLARPPQQVAVVAQARPLSCLGRHGRETSGDHRQRTVGSEVPCPRATPYGAPRCTWTGR